MWSHPTKCPDDERIPQPDHRQDTVAKACKASLNDRRDYSPVGLRARQPCNRVGKKSAMKDRIHGRDLMQHDRSVVQLSRKRPCADLAVMIAAIGSDDLDLWPFDKPPVRSTTLHLVVDTHGLVRWQTV